MNKQNRSYISLLFQHLNQCIHALHGEIGSPDVPPNPFHRIEDGLYKIYRDGNWFMVRVEKVNGEEP